LTAVYFAPSFFLKNVNEKNPKVYQMNYLAGQDRKNFRIGMGYKKFSNG